MTTNQTISTLKHGQSARLSGDSRCWTTVERSGNGKTIRYVRHTPNGCEVFKEERA